MDALSVAVELFDFVAGIFNKLTPSVAVSCSDELSRDALARSAAIMNAACVLYPELRSIAALYRQVGEMLLLFQQTGCINIDAANRARDQCVTVMAALNAGNGRLANRVSRIFHP